LKPIKAVSVTFSPTNDHRWAALAYYNDQPTVVGGSNAAGKVATLSMTHGWQDLAEYPLYINTLLICCRILNYF
jgi:hypothetical protein